MKSKKEFVQSGFTLAEVLITLGVIGVVAALTMPILIGTYRKHVVEARLSKFYSTMNQAILRSEADNGPKEFWEPITNDFELDDDGKVDLQTSSGLAWYKKYLAPYLNVIKIEINDKYGNVMVYFPDGGLCLMGEGSFQYWVDGKNAEPFLFDSEQNRYRNNAKASGIKYFTFQFAPWNKNNKYFYKKGMEPYIWGSWNGDISALLNSSSIGCRENVTNERAACTKLIQMNGWKIPKDYPLKF